MVNLTKTVLYMGKMLKNDVFYWTLHTTYGENEKFFQLMHIDITIDDKMHTFGC